ncbi:MULTISPECIES: hypothetical protein [Bacteria]|uniref:hypothetical protein n=1 Tax=Bacteria TaxID=2 RepID=UPI001865FF9D|nr:hypothetical protein [Pseudoalteromonas undina]
MGFSQEMRRLELKETIKTIELELEFQDFTQKESTGKRAELRQVKLELQQLQNQ